jgi:acetate---CoA ligase (ADP-forming)
VSVPDRRPVVRALLEARHVAVVGASPRPGSLGERLLMELERSPSQPTIHLVNPRYDKIGSRACLPSLGEIPEPVDLVALAVGDHALEEQLHLAAGRGDRAAVIYGSAFDDPGPAPRQRGARRSRLAAIAEGAGMAVCGAGCMGFVNVARGLRAIGYLEPDPLPAGPIALVTHSGSAFSALLRADRRLGWTIAVSSGQELVTTAADYIDYALDLEETKVIALLLETLRRPEALRAALVRAAEAGVAVVALTVGGSPGGRAMVEAHSGAIAGDDAAWEALCDATGMIRARDLVELADTLELFAAGRRPLPVAPERPRGIASVHDSGAERALAVDLAHHLGVPWATLGAATTERLGGLLDNGLEATNPLDVWGTGAATRELFAGALQALADDEAVDAVALCVDLVPELDGDTSYQDAVLDVWGRTAKPMCVLSNLPSAIDRPVARQLRAAGIPVLEGTGSGLAALGHLVALRSSRPVTPAPIDAVRRRRWGARLERGPLGGADGMALLAEYGIPVVETRAAADLEGALAAAAAIGYPVVLKTDRQGIAHKSDVGGVIVGIGGPGDLAAGYADLAARLGPAVVIMATAEAGIELALGVVRDPLVGPLVVVGAGGVLIELLADRSVGLPPLDLAAARRLVGRLRVSSLLAGARGAPAADLDAVAAAVVAVGRLALELGDVIEALDVNPLRAGPSGVAALDVLVVLA